MKNRLANAQAIFWTAMECDSSVDREEYLCRACADDDELRLEVEALIRAHHEAGTFLESPPTGMAATQTIGAANEPVGSLIGPYKLLELIGKGGFGVVYLAEQLHPVRRKVALKIIKPGMDTQEVIARFEAERQALALMDHPNIAHVLDAGATDSGRPYFVMELVRGIPITDYCDECNLTTRERLELFVTVCQAVQHAHQKGIIHRDLKPSNVMIAMQDGRSVSKVIDFGVAKAVNQRLTDATVHTQFAQMIGTPLYMSPEQAEQSPLDIDTRSDVYSLGVLLYVLLTGTTPFARERLHDASYDEMRRIIREEEPSKPSSRVSTDRELAVTIAEHRRTDPRRLNQQLRGDLDWIVMKCLDKDRTRRYESASALAADVQRNLNHEPVEARPRSSVYKFRRFARRNRAALATAFIIALTVFAGLATNTVLVGREQRRTQSALIQSQHNFRAAESAHKEAEVQRQVAVAARQQQSRQRREAVQQRDMAYENLYLAHIRLAQQDWEAGHVARMLDLLDSHRPRAGEPDRRGWEWYYLYSLCHKDRLTLRGHSERVWSVAWGPDGRRVASASWDHTVNIWDASTGKRTVALRGYPGRVYAMSWSPDGTRIAAAGSASKITVWDAATGEEKASLALAGNFVHSLAWSPDGKKFASAPWSGKLTVQDAATGDEVLSVRGKMHRSVAWSPDGTKLASGGGYFDSNVRVYDAATGNILSTFEGHTRGVNALSFSPDGTRLASVAWDQTVRVWNVGQDQLQPPFDLLDHAGNVYSVAWSSDGKRLASAGADGTAKVWDAENGRLQKTIRGHRGVVYSVDWSPDAERLVSGGSDATVKIWDVETEDEERSLAGRLRSAWSPDGRHIAAAVGDWGNVGVFEAATGKQIQTLTYPETGWLASIAWSSKGNRLAAASSDGSVTVWDMTTGKESFRLKAHALEARSIDWSPDGSLLATAGMDAKVKIWDATTGREIQLMEHPGAAGSVAWSPDGKWLASAGWNQEVFVWEAASARKALDLRRNPGLFEDVADGQYSIAWSPDGTHLAAGSSEGAIIIWNVTTGREVLSMQGHTANVRSVDWSPDGKRIASCSEDRMVKVWDAATGNELVAMKGHRRSRKGLIDSVAWSPDGKRLASASGAGLKIWDAAYAIERENRTK